jgi:hypothetical protein
MWTAWRPCITRLFFMFSAMGASYVCHARGCSQFSLDLTERYREKGLHSGHFVDLAVVPLGAKAALATLTWELWRADQACCADFDGAITFAVLVLLG